jgi:GT2 family glycosyltransferase
LLKNNSEDNAENASCIKKIDLVMWTLNSAKTLPFTLRSIENAIPKEYVNQRIMVDGFSVDGTQNIGKKFGWRVLDAEKVGIPYQANQALDNVETEIFASFEHDIILNPNWFHAVLRHLESDPSVAVAQGVRLTTNHVFKKIEEVCLERNIPYRSIDNNMYRTEVIKKLGGFDPRFLISCDWELQERVQKAGYKWISDKTVVSDHIRGDLWNITNHFWELSKLDDPNNPAISPVLARFLYSPIRGLDISIKKRCPHAALVYPYWRFIHLKAALASNKRAKS